MSSNGDANYPEYELRQETDVNDNNLNNVAFNQHKLDLNTQDKKFMRYEKGGNLAHRQSLLKSENSTDLNIASHSSRVHFEGINESNPTKFNGQ